jgi:hypothetical protein
LFYIKKQIDTQNIKNSLKNQKSKFGARIIWMRVWVSLLQKKGDNAYLSKYSM